LAGLAEPDDANPGSPEITGFFIIAAGLAERGRNGGANKPVIKLSMPA
jgi:hypothetical protein